MGTCCNAHLATKIRGYARNAQNGAVTVTVIENPEVKILNIDQINANQKDASIVPSYLGKCDYCNAPAEFNVSYYTKPKLENKTT